MSTVESYAIVSNCCNSLYVEKTKVGCKLRFRLYSMDCSDSFQGTCSMAKTLKSYGFEKNVAGYVYNPVL
ncbi:TPA: hypothetical protein QCY62_003860 [Bacillus cereus]|nr:hypothetical protein [Bacillus cereus]